MRLSIIVAMDERGVIGRGNDLPWHLPADLQRFKKLTMGHHLLLGRKTFESIGRALPGRQMIVVSRSRLQLPAEVRLAGSIKEAISIAEGAGDDEAFVGGGAEIYRQTLQFADRIYLTRLHARVDGDSSFPDFDVADWKLVDMESHEPDERNRYAYTYLIFDRE